MRNTCTSANSCSYSEAYSAAAHNYYAKAFDTKNNLAQSATQSFSVASLEYCNLNHYGPSSGIVGKTPNPRAGFTATCPAGTKISYFMTYNRPQDGGATWVCSWEYTGGDRYQTHTFTYAGEEIRAECGMIFTGYSSCDPGAGGDPSEEIESGGCSQSSPELAGKFDHIGQWYLSVNVEVREAPELIEVGSQTYYPYVSCPSCSSEGFECDAYDTKLGPGTGCTGSGTLILSCGTCPSGKVCENYKCVTPVCASSGQACNVESDCCNPTDNYCSQSKCCPKGTRGDTNENRCIFFTECGQYDLPDLPGRCNYNILTKFPDWLIDNDCRRPTTPTYTTVCVPANLGFSNRNYFFGVSIY